MNIEHLPSVSIFVLFLSCVNFSLYFAAIFLTLFVKFFCGNCANSLGFDSFKPFRFGRLWGSSFPLSKPFMMNAFASESFQICVLSHG